MKYSKHLAFFSMAFSVAFSVTAYGSNIEVQDIDSVRFEGRCVLIDFNPDIIIGTFNLNPIDNEETTVLAREINQDGNEVDTKVRISFRMFDELSLGFDSHVDGELTPKILGDSHLSNPAIGNRIRATLPLQLGGRVDCSGIIHGSQK